MSQPCRYGNCEEPAVDGRLCHTHHVEAKKRDWLDNTNRDDLGIVRWAKEMLPEFCPQESPTFHKDLYLNLLNLYNPEYRNKHERFFEFISFRGSAKSTAANTIFVSYIIAHNGQKSRITFGGRTFTVVIKEATIIIVSETSEGAQEFTVRVRDTFSTSERLKYYYRAPIEAARDDSTGQWTRASFKINDIYIQARGAGQQMRGKVKGRARPTLIIADDIYSENNTKTELNRKKIKNWWNDTVINSIDDLLGKAVVLGTILHEDTILVGLQNDPLWRLIKVPAMGHINEYYEVQLDTFHEFVDCHMQVDWVAGTCILPFDDIRGQDERFRKQRKYFDKVQAEKDWELAWPERLDLYHLAIKYQSAVHNNTVDGLYQEYFHITKSPHSKRFKPEYFNYVEPKEVEYKKQHGMNWLRLYDEWYSCNIEMGVDISGGGADEAVVTVVASLPDQRVVVLEQICGRFSIRDNIQGDTAPDVRRYKVAVSEKVIISRGLVDEVFRAAIRYNPSKIKVGIAGEEDQIREEIQRVFSNNNMHTTYIMGRKQQANEGRKEERIMNTLLPYYETRMMYHKGRQRTLEYQLEYLGSTEHDDRADSLECAIYALEMPYHSLKLEDYTSEVVEEVDAFADRFKPNKKKDWQVI